MAIEGLPGNHAGAGPGLSHQEGLVRDFGEIDAPALRQRVVGAGEDHHRVVHDRLHDQVLIGRRVGKDVEIVLVAGQTLDHSLPVVDLQRDLDTGMALDEVRKQARCKVLAGGAAGQSQSASLQAPQGGEIVFETAEGAEQFFAAFQQDLPCSGQMDFSPDLLEELQLKGIGQLADLGGHRGLGQVQRFGRSGDAAQPGNRLEDRELRKHAVPKQSADVAVDHERPLR